MSKEFTVLEAAIENEEVVVEQSLTHVNELTLALVGGGNQVVLF